MKILVVCGAGASSTFVAQRLRSALHAAGLSHEVEACSESAVDRQLSDVDLVLVGPHLAASFEQVRALATAGGTQARLLPHDVAGDLDGSRTLALILEALPETSLPQGTRERHAP